MDLDEEGKRLGWMMGHQANIFSKYILGTHLNNRTNRLFYVSYV